MSRFLRKLVFVWFPDGKRLHAKSLTLESKNFSINERLCQKRKGVCDIGNGYRLFRHQIHPLVQAYPCFFKVAPRHSLSTLLHMDEFTCPSQNLCPNTRTILNCAAQNNRSGFFSSRSLSLDYWQSCKSCILPVPGLASSGTLRLA